MKKLLIIFILFTFSCSSTTEPEVNPGTKYEPADTTEHQLPDLEILVSEISYDIGNANLVIRVVVTNNSPVAAFNPYCSSMTWEDSLGAIHIEDKRVPFELDVIEEREINLVNVPFEQELRPNNIAYVKLYFEYEYLVSSSCSLGYRFQYK